MQEDIYLRMKALGQHLQDLGKYEYIDREFVTKLQIFGVSACKFEFVKSEVARAFGDKLA